MKIQSFLKLELEAYNYNVPKLINLAYRGKKNFTRMVIQKTPQRSVGRSSKSNLRSLE